jgi:hypothetical protein
MAIRPRCDMRISKNCEDELKHFGGILFSPPLAGKFVPMKGGKVKKFHVCVPCFRTIMKIRGQSKGG